MIDSDSEQDDAAMPPASAGSRCSQEIACDRFSAKGNTMRKDEAARSLMYDTDVGPFVLLAFLVVFAALAALKCFGVL